MSTENTLSPIQIRLAFFNLKRERETVPKIPTRGPAKWWNMNAMCRLKLQAYNQIQDNNACLH